MNRRSARSPQARAARAGRASAQQAALAAAIIEDATVLGASAIPAGLAALRPRSSPDRLVLETARFVGFLGSTLANASEVGARAAAEVRDGSLAAASPDEVAGVFALWRRVLAAYLLAIGRSGAEPEVAATLERMEVAAAAAERAWARVRLDVVVVGSSAGGLEPVTAILHALPATAPVTLAIVQHIGPTDRGLLPTVLGRHSRLAIAAAVDGARLYLGHAYIAPPGRHLVLEPGALRLVEGPPVHFVKPAADILFESAAQAYGSRAASVVLSGSGRDGAAGTCAIHDHGGVTFCQDPGDAEFRGMPEAAVATGRVDRGLPLGALVSALAATIANGRSDVSGNLQVEDA